nr:MAG TPA: hypothetical protein [Caudoviricetes sp.]
MKKRIIRACIKIKFNKTYKDIYIVSFIIRF